MLLAWIIQCSFLWLISHNRGFDFIVINRHLPWLILFDCDKKFRTSLPKFISNHRWFCNSIHPDWMILNVFCGLPFVDYPILAYYRSYSFCYQISSFGHDNEVSKLVSRLQSLAAYGSTSASGWRLFSGKTIRNTLGKASHTAPFTFSDFVIESIK